ncbi:unnamed protein product [Moneuplotes crassus]|uniref:Uncharacterized protein n=1 Tax=Euplotes crassus TaxID=5936 RepID=A0AAD1XAR1_EUPCR|nr:unnamed protein product [Moneuplotes crassus]
MKQQINNAYDINNVLALENELAHNKQVIVKLLAQNKGLMNVKKGQSKAMKKLIMIQIHRKGWKLLRRIYKKLRNFKRERR